MWGMKRNNEVKKLGTLYMFEPLFWKVVIEIISSKNSTSCIFHTSVFPLPACTGKLIGDFDKSKGSAHNGSNGIRKHKPIVNAKCNFTLISPGISVIFNNVSFYNVIFNMCQFLYSVIFNTCHF